MMRPITRCLVLAAVFLLLPVLAPGGYAKVYLVDFDEAEAEFLMLQAINTIRYSQGLPLVGIDENLGRSARRHALDMARRDYFDHFSLEGESPEDRARSLGVPNPVSENIGIIRTFGQSLPEVVGALMEGFLDSPEHRRNLLDPDVTHVGIGFSQDVDGSNHRLAVGTDPEALYRGFGTVLVVQDFCRKRVSLVEPSPYHGWTHPGEFMTLCLDFTDEVSDAFLRIVAEQDPAATFDVPMTRGSGGFRARFAIEREGAFRIGIYANSPAADWFYSEQGEIEVTVKPHGL